jgi:hypothetical protein
MGRRGGSSRISPVLAARTSALAGAFPSFAVKLMMTPELAYRGASFAAAVPAAQNRHAHVHPAGTSLK